MPEHPLVRCANKPMSEHHHVPGIRGVVQYPAFLHAGRNFHDKENRHPRNQGTI